MAKSKVSGRFDDSGSGSAMAALLASSQIAIPSLRRGQEVSGKVVMVGHSEILVDISAKSEGIVSGRELTATRDLAAKISVGDTIEATVLYPENDAGQVVLSLRKLSGEKRWQELEEKRESGDQIEVVAQESNRGGIICDFLGIRGFLPASQLARPPSKLESLIGRGLTVSVIEVDRPTNRLIFSQKKPGKKDLSALLVLLSGVKIGEKYQGIVSAILPFGVFVEINLGESKNALAKSRVVKVFSERKRDQVKSEEKEPKGAKLEGLVHISEISWEKVEDPTTMFKVGDRVDVVVIAKDATTGRLNLSIKQLTRDPFFEACAKYSKDMKVVGVVSRVTPFGVFVTLDSKIEGLIHISKIPPNVVWSEGDKIECEIESVDVPARKIALVPIVREKPVLYR